jgi:2-iminobutanoate/2-iminopropanoate deaminase
LRGETVEKIQTKHAPQAIGPYSQAIKAESFIFVSGQLGLNPSGEPAEGDVEDQTHQALRNLGAILEASGSGLDRVVKVTAYLADMDDFRAFNRAYAEYFDEPYPARAAFEVVRLPRDVRVEVECIALVG